MPILNSTYTPPRWLRNGHIATLYTHFFRKVTEVSYERERLELSDGDFIDLDWSYTKNTEKKGIVLIIHGLEGNSQRPYMLGMVDSCTKNGFDAVAMNLRACSGSPNRLYASYYGGSTADVQKVLQHISKKSYERINLVGFSLGGNILLKFLGEKYPEVSLINSSAAFSAPIDLYDSVLEISKTKNYLYAKRFVNHLKVKLHQKSLKFPEHITKDQINKCVSLIDIDNLYTSKAHGFTDAMEYYSQCSAKNNLLNITTPTLLINAIDDPFLGTACYPKAAAATNKNFFLEIPKYGGHVGFMQKTAQSYLEKRALEFFNTSFSDN
ncbi:YheT family hydrolase [Aquimarina brevivitae]|uniref:AB hydrolase-1 domain-containing protein n=1 Tax=Aquimarina brevivitae TaxID=323412 RepID=A0A4Q7PF93_9FLAO|nr:alpha/beta fold hydrolase [Aquimarina brevivitae]RZS99126.1 hypothetical protein EV197_0331 [Aquimarina brevivitae]